jgi:hypothetical protein
MQGWAYAVVEFGEEFSVEEEIGCGGEFVGDGVEEDLGTVVFVCFVGALFGSEGEEAHFYDRGAIA